jgi:Co/Zn/Cd efflux system component
MLLAILTRTVIAGAYLMGLLWHGLFDTLAALLAAAVVLIWAAPLIRSALRRHTVVTNSPSSISMEP